jgi:UrcA family protein
MTNFATRISTAAMLALAVLPIGALASAAHAETRVHVADLNLLTAQGVAEFNERAADAGRQYCLTERTVGGRQACIGGVKAEMTEKLADLRARQLAQAGQTFAAR